MSIEYLINRILDLDPDLQQLIEPLHGKHIDLICTDFPKLNIILSFDYKYLRININNKEVAQIDTYISGPLYGLLKLAIQKQQADIRDCQIKITGDLHTAQLLQDFLFRLDLDWEEALSAYTGDVIAHQAMYAIKQIRNLQKETHTSLEQMITEYLQEESNILPTAYEINNFMHDVDQLRMDVDRLEARIKAHENT